MKELPDKPSRCATPDALHKAANKARIEHPYREVKRHTNPYTGELILDMASYERYIREHAYYDLCDYQIELNDKKNQQELDFLHANLTTVQEKASAADRYRRNSKRLLFLFLASILSIVVLIVVASRKIDNAFSEGHSTGYSEGQEAGYQSGYSEGEDSGYSNGKRDGYSEGKDDGYEQGYREGSYSRPSDTSSVSPWTASSGEEYRNNYLKNIEGTPISYGYIGNKNTHKFHLSTCSYLPEKQNRIAFDSYDEAISNGYDPCGHCNP